MQAVALAASAAVQRVAVVLMMRRQWLRAVARELYDEDEKSEDATRVIHGVEVRDFGFLTQRSLDGLALGVRRLVEDRRGTRVGPLGHRRPADPIYAQVLQRREDELTELCGLTAAEVDDVERLCGAHVRRPMDPYARLHPGQLAAVRARAVKLGSVRDRIFGYLVYLRQGMTYAAFAARQAVSVNTAAREINHIAQALRHGLDAEISLPQPFELLALQNSFDGLGVPACVLVVDQFSQSVTYDYRCNTYYNAHVAHPSLATLLAVDINGFIRFFSCGLPGGITNDRGHYNISQLRHWLAQQNSFVLGDEGYRGPGRIITRLRAAANPGLTADERAAFNRVLAHHRALVEQTNRRLACWAFVRRHFMTPGRAKLHLFNVALLCNLQLRSRGNPFIARAIEELRSVVLTERELLTRLGAEGAFPDRYQNHYD